MIQISQWPASFTPGASARAGRAGEGLISAMSGAVPAGSTPLPMALFDLADGVREFGSGVYPP